MPPMVFYDNWSLNTLKLERFEAWTLWSLNALKLERLEAWTLGSLNAWKLERLEAWTLGSLNAWKLERFEAWTLGSLNALMLERLGHFFEIISHLISYRAPWASLSLRAQAQLSKKFSWLSSTTKLSLWNGTPLKTRYIETRKNEKSEVNA